MISIIKEAIKEANKNPGSSNSDNIQTYLIK